MLVMVKGGCRNSSYGQRRKAKLAGPELGIFRLKKSRLVRNMIAFFRSLTRGYRKTG